MALVGNDLGDLIAEVITDSNAPVEVALQIKQLWEQIGTVIVDYFKTNTVVNTTVAVGIGVQVVPATGTGATNTTGTATGSIS